MPNTTIHDRTLEPPASSTINNMRTWRDDLEGGGLIEIWDIGVRIWQCHWNISE